MTDLNEEFYRPKDVLSFCRISIDRIPITSRERVRDMVRVRVRIGLWIGIGSGLKFGELECGELKFRLNEKEPYKMPTQGKI